MMFQAKNLEKETGAVFSIIIAAQESTKGKGMQVVPYVKSSDPAAFKLLKEDNKSLTDSVSASILVAFENKKSCKDV